MTRLEEAKDRLERAVAQLDAASKAMATNAGDERMHEKLAEGLAEALQATQADYTALKEVTETVSERLDAAIGRLRGVLGG